MKNPAPSFAAEALNALIFIAAHLTPPRAVMSGPIIIEPVEFVIDTDDDRCVAPISNPPILPVVAVIEPLISTAVPVHFR